jgi:ABC-type glycerol-3-phosphate transport system permease component
MDNINESFFSAASGKDIARSVIISTATTVSMIGVMTAVAYAMKKLEDRRESKKSV